MEIDLWRAIFVLCQFGKGVGVMSGVNLDSAVGDFRDPLTPSKIMARTSIARVNRGWDKVESFPRSCSLVMLPVPPFDSSLIMRTSSETCIDSISGKLQRRNNAFTFVDNSSKG